VQLRNVVVEFSSLGSQDRWGETEVDDLSVADSPQGLEAGYGAAEASA